MLKGVTVTTPQPFNPGTEMKGFAAVLRAAMKREGYTIDRLAHVTGIGRSTIGRYLTGERFPQSVEQLVAVLRAPELRRFTPPPRRYGPKPRHIFEDPELGVVRLCAGCGEAWPFDGEFFYRQDTRCRACQAERRRAA